MKLTLIVILSLLLSLAAAEVAVSPLQAAFERAFNEKVADGTWNTLLADHVSLTTACPGNVDAWPWPEVGGDLEACINSGTIVNGINTDLVVTAVDGALLIGADGSGAVGEFFQACLDTINAHYSSTMVFQWDDQFASSNDILTAVSDGTMDAAIGIWGLGGAYNGMARPRSMSALACPIYSAAVKIWAPTSLAHASLSEVIDRVKAGDAVCTSTSPGGGTAQGCGDSLSQYGTAVSCLGANADAWTKALDDSDSECIYVFDNGPPANLMDQFTSFDTPFTALQGSLFRPLAPVAGADCNCPVCGDECPPSAACEECEECPSPECPNAGHALSAGPALCGAAAAAACTAACA